MRISKKEYLELNEYVELAEAINIVSTMILFCFAKSTNSIKDNILRNFVARSTISQMSIFALYELKDYSGAWVIHRTLLDRLFHLHSIGARDEYVDFDDWSFFNQYRDQNRLRSDPQFDVEASGWVYELSDDQKKRIQRLSNNKPQWKRPKAEDVAKDMGLEFLYKYGYDYASKLVHPLSDDGLQDFYEITGLEPRPKYPSQISVLSNSILANTLVIQSAMNSCSLSWVKILWDLIDSFRLALDGNLEEYKLTLVKLCELYKQGEICARKSV